MTTTPLPIPFSIPAKIDSSIGGLLLASGKITPQDAECIIRLQRELGIRFGEAAVRLDLITEADIQQILAKQFDYPYLQPDDKTFSSLLVAAYQPFSPQTETLRAVRSQIMLRWIMHGHKSFTIMGVDSGDGASLFAANLSVVFSQLGEKTLLVDANLRTPSQHNVFSLQGTRGLSDILAGRADANVISKIESFVDLSVLPAGTLPPNPQELLNRTPFRHLNDQLEAHYDIVLYDVAALSAGSDALAIASRTRGVVMVVRKDKTQMKDIDAMVAKIKLCGADVIGSVLVDF